MSEITKEELLAMIDVQSRSAAAMENIANSLRMVSEQNKDFVKSQAELVKNAIEEREKCTANICIVLDKGIKEATKEALGSKAIIDSIKSDTGWLKIILGSAALIILIATVVVNNISIAKNVEKAFQEHLKTEAIK